MIAFLLLSWQLLNSIHYVMPCWTMICNQNDWLNILQASYWKEKKHSKLFEKGIIYQTVITITMQCTKFFTDKSTHNRNDFKEGTTVAVYAYLGEVHAFKFWRKLPVKSMKLCTLFFALLTLCYGIVLTQLPSRSVYFNKFCPQFSSFSFPMRVSLSNPFAFTNG